MTLNKTNVKTIKEIPETIHMHSDSRMNFEESLLRNQKFVKDLELAKARLRTLAAYTPTDEELQKFSLAYRNLLQKRSNT